VNNIGQVIAILIFGIYFKDLKIQRVIRTDQQFMLIFQQVEMINDTLWLLNTEIINDVNIIITFM
jgi:hypothetical protein